ncbi:unnamed protein product, partial [Linum tenue]
HSPTIEAALRLQPRCSEKTERDSGLLSFTTRLLVPSSQIGCLLGKGGSIINEMRNVTNANIRILGKDNVPKVAADDDEMVQVIMHGRVFPICLWGIILVSVFTEPANYEFGYMLMNRSLGNLMSPRMHS